MTATRRLSLVVLGAAATLAAVSPDRLVAQSAVGTVLRLRVFGASLAGNLLGEPADPHVSIYLPPSYDADPARRYPVVYLLHAYGTTDQSWFGEGAIQAAVAARRAIARGARELILVMPNCYNAYGGCMYANSATTGYWEDYVAGDLVGWIDARYRTIARPEGRGLAGHAMGGAGALRIGMKRPDVFSAIYALSPCCLAETSPATGDAARRIEAFRTPQEAGRNAAAQGLFARSAAWAPNPANPPFFFDLPTRDGIVRAEVMARWAAHSPAALLDSHVPTLRRLTAIALDVGDYDRSVPVASVRGLSSAMHARGVPHTFETYDGDHVNRLTERIETHVLPFFSHHLALHPAAPPDRQ